jgi:hypothetical protein
MTREHRRRPDLEAVKLETAKHIRSELDAARRVAEAGGSDPDDFEGAILESVTGLARASEQG